MPRFAVCGGTVYTVPYYSLSEGNTKERIGTIHYGKGKNGGIIIFCIMEVGWVYTYRMYAPIGMQIVSDFGRVKEFVIGIKCLNSMTAIELSAQQKDVILKMRNGHGRLSYYIAGSKYHFAIYHKEFKVSPISVDARTGKSLIKKTELLSAMKGERSSYELTELGKTIEL